MEGGEESRGKGWRRMDGGGIGSYLWKRLITAPVILTWRRAPMSVVDQADQRKNFQMTVWGEGVKQFLCKA